MVSWRKTQRYLINYYEIIVNCVEKKKKRQRWIVCWLLDGHSVCAHARYFFEISKNVRETICCVNLSSYCTRFDLNCPFNSTVSFNIPSIATVFALATVIMNYSIKFYVTPSQKQTANTHWARPCIYFMP